MPGGLIDDIMRGLGLERETDKQRRQRAVMTESSRKMAGMTAGSSMTPSDQALEA